MAHHGMTTDFTRLQLKLASLNDPTFGRLLPHNPVTLPADPNDARARLSKLATSMKTSEDVPGDVSAGLTFFGQFVDHDITLDVSTELGHAADVEDLRNVRTPTLDLDCVFGGGPEATPYFYSQRHHGYLLFGTKDNELDLARNCDGTALIGDPRNDENAIVSQIQGYCIQFYNIVYAIVSDKGSAEYRAHRHISEDPRKIAVTLARWHYQWIIMHEFLPGFVDADVLAGVIATLKRNQLPKPFTNKSPFIPIEFAGAAYRFGHATAQNRYKINVGTTATLFDQGDGSPSLPAFGPRPKAFTIDPALFFTVPGAPPPQTARPIGIKLAEELFDLPFARSTAAVMGEGGLEIPAEELSSLAHRNIYRDRFTYELASGQQAAAAMHFTPIDRNQQTRDAGLDKIPLWYYCLQEAAEQGNGKLGQVGGTLVATVLLRLLRDDKGSVWHRHDWKPVFGAAGGGYSFGHMAAWVDDNRGKVSFWEDLICPR